MRFACLILLSLLVSTQGWAAEKPSLVEEGVAAFKVGRNDLAIEKFSTALKANPENSVAYNDRGLAYKAQKNYARAVADFTAALRLEPAWFLYYNRGVAYQESGDPKSAIVDLTTVLKNVPPKSTGEIDCRIARAHAYFDQERAKLALEDLNIAIEIGTKEPDAYILRGILHKIEHNYALSLADYENAIALDDKEARAYDAEAYLLSVCPAPKFRDGRKAISYATKACELMEWKDSQSMETLAAADAEKQEFDEALRWQKKAAELDPKATDSSRLDLYERKRPFRDLNRAEKPITDLSDLRNPVRIKLGESLSAKFANREGALLEPKVRSGRHREASSLLLDFHLEKRGHVLLVEHTFWRTLKVRCYARLVGYDTYFETNLLPIPVSKISPELWSDPIEELVLFDFQLTGVEQQPSEPEEESQVASLNLGNELSVGAD
ncbi:MAG: tetratricopeptide repeat protein [Chthoniobacterales bacterium]